MFMDEKESRKYRAMERGVVDLITSLMQGMFRIFPSKQLPESTASCKRNASRDLRSENAETRGEQRGQGGKRKKRGDERIRRETGSTGKTGGTETIVGPHAVLGWVGCVDSDVLAAAVAQQRRLRRQRMIVGVLAPCYSCSLPLRTAEISPARSTVLACNWVARQDAGTVD